MPSTIILHATLNKIDQYNNLVFSYFYPDSNQSKQKLNALVAKKCKKLDTDKYVYTPNTSSGFKIKIQKSQRLDELKGFIGEAVEIATDLSYYKFKKSDGEQIQGYKLTLKNITEIEID